MNFNLKLSKNLELISITENNWEDEKLIAVECFFKFYGEEGLAYVSIERLESKFPRYAMTEISSELAESFNDLLQSRENWNKIISSIKDFIEKDWIRSCMSYYAICE